MTDVVAALLFDKGSGAEVDVRCWAKNPCPASPVGAEYSLAIRVRLTNEPRRGGMCESPVEMCPSASLGDRLQLRTAGADGHRAEPRCELLITND
jgi:hypothetical protein